MRKTLVALCFILAISLVGVSFAQENTTAAEAPSTPSTPSTPSNEPPVETLVNTGKEEQNIQETEPIVTIPAQMVSSDPMTIEELAYLSFFDIEQESAYSFAAQSENVIIKTIVGTVTVLAEHENGIYELQVSVPELNNEFCFNCVEEFPYELGDTVTVYVVIQSQN